MNKRPTLGSLSLIVCGLVAAMAGIPPASAQHAGGHAGFAGHFGGYRGGYGWGHGWRGGYGYWGPWGWGGLGLGLYFATLPLYYSTYWWDGIPYYYSDNTYYRWNGAVNQYETVNPPPGLQAPLAQEGPLAGVSELIAYPKNGQSQEQQGKDKFECHRWAAAQTGFDPTQVTSASVAGRRSDYLRAQGACLEGRGYSVK
jgi:hypothetical protein